jgi:hypothetical protein
MSPRHDAHDETPLTPAANGEPSRPGREPADTSRRRLMSLTSQLRRAHAGEPGAGRPTDDGRAAPPPPGPLPAPVAPAAASEPAAARPPAARPGAELPPPPARRPSRPLLTLQQVHERTGIPYPTLAFYAASEADRIPSAGERYAPLYRWEALAAFCRLHHERNPSWQPPALPPAPPLGTPLGEALPDRLEALESAQIALVDEIRAFLESEGDDPLVGTTTA